MRSVFIQHDDSRPQLTTLKATGVNNFVIEEAEKYGIRSYVFVPCIVCKRPISILILLSWAVLMLKFTAGEGEGFGNKISIQTKAVVKAGRAMRKVAKPDSMNGVSL